MTSKERENFLRNAILVVDHSKAALVSLVELYLQNKGQTFENFVNTNQHEIYHLYNSSRCCQCPPGHHPIRSPRILHQSQIEFLFDRTSKLPCHNTTTRSVDFCCSMARSGLCTNVLDLTLARCLLVNFCEDVFWFSCLQFQSITLEDFLNHHKHELYHLWQNNAPCCQCSPGYTFPTNYSMLNQNDWMQMFNAVLLPCTNHRKRPSPGGMQSICSVAATPGITLINLGPSVGRIILQHCSTLRRDVETLVQIRNQDYGHAKEGIMSDNDYNASVVKIERCILDIAKVCIKETQFRQKLREARDGALDQTLFTQYQNNLMETITRQADFHQGVAELAPTLNKISKQIAVKEGKMPKLMDECVRKGFDYQEQLMERFNQKLVKVKNQTHMEIDYHVEQETFVETNAVRKCKEWMNKKDVFVIIGNEGAGKSRIGLEILRQFGIMDEDFDLLKVANIQQVKDIITDERKTAILIDDGFPSKEYSNKNLNNSDILDFLSARKHKGNMKIILTADSSTMSSFKIVLFSHGLFQNCCKIDLSTDRFCMSEEEKASLLFNFCKIQNISTTWDSYDGNEGFSLDRKTVYDIAKTDPFTGYPKLCYMFTSNKRFLQLGINFFKHPDQSLMDEINSLRDSTDINPDLNISYALLVYTLLNTGCLKINEIDLSKLETIMESICNSQRRRLFDSKVKKIAEQMEGRFLKQDFKTMFYHLKHTMIYEALAISYFEVNPSAVISVLKFDFIIDLIRLERDDWGQKRTCLIITKEMFIYLIERLFTIFEKDYKMRSAEFTKTLCGSAIILQNNPDFIGSLFKQFANCTSQDAMGIQIEGRFDKISFNFPRALLWFLIQKHNVDKPIATVLHFVENDMKDEQNIKKVKESKKVAVACFYYLCETENSDMKLELIYGLINEYDIECSYDYSIQIALKNGNDPVVSFLLSHVSKKIDIVKLVLEVEHAEDMTRLCDLISTNLSIECIDTDNKPDILKILIRSVPQNFFNVRESINTACSKRCEDFVTAILSDNRNFSFDTCTVVNTACENGWQDALKVLLNKKLCNQSEKKQIFIASCKDGMETFLKWIFETVDTDELDVQQFVLHEFRCENFETVQNFILKLQDNQEMETMIKNSVTKFNLPVIRFIKWVLEDTEKQIVAGNNDHLQRLYIVQWIYERFLNIQINVRSTVYKTINDSCDNADEILQWLNENTKGIVHPITTLMDLSCKNDLQKIVKWILQTFDQNIFNICDLIIESYKVGNTKMAEVFIREIDLLKIDVTSVITAMLSTCQSNSSKDLLLFLIQNIDQQYCRWMEIITIITDLELYNYIQLILQYADNSKIDMMNIVKTKMNVLSEKKLKDLIQSIKKELLDINYIVWAALKNEYNDIVVWSLKNDDQNAIKKSDIFYVAVYNHNTNVMHYLLETTDHTLLNIETAVEIACRRGKFDIVEMLLLKVDDDAFNVKAAIDAVVGDITFDTVKNVSHDDNIFDNNLNKITECQRIKIVKLMLKQFNHKLFDMTTIMNTAFKQRWFDLIKWLIAEVDDSLLDLNEILSMACQSERSDIVTLLAGKIENSNLDKGAVTRMVNVMNEACLKGNFITVKWLIKNFNNKLFDMKEAMNNACRLGNLDAVEWLRENIDNKLFDIKDVLYSACWVKNIDTVKWLIENFDNNLFHMMKVMNKACRLGKLDIVKWLIGNFDNTLFDMQEAMNNACRWENRATVQWLIENIDNKSFDMNDVLDSVCGEINVDTVKWLIKNFDNNLFDMKKVMNTACIRGQLDIVKWLKKNFDYKLFDMQEAMNDACQSENFETMKWLKENFHNKLVDMKETMKIASLFDHLDTMQWLIKNFDNKLFDMKEIMNEACSYGNLDRVKLLIKSVDNKLFDMEKAMHAACLEGNLETVKWLVKNFDNTLFDMKEAMKVACVFDYLGIMEWFIENIDNKLFDMEDVFNSDCWMKNVDTVKWLIENFDNNLFDMKEAMNKACRLGKLDIVKWLIGNFDNNLFDMKEAMNNACRSENLDTVKWLIDNFDNKLFDMKEAMNNACRSENLDTVKWLIDNFDNKLFEMQKAMKNACQWGKLDTMKWLIENFDDKLFDMKAVLNSDCWVKNVDTVKWLIENFDNNLFDMKEAMNKACRLGKLDIVKWFIENFDNNYLI